MPTSFVSRREQRGGKLSPVYRLDSIHFRKFCEPTADLQIVLSPNLQGQSVFGVPCYLRDKRGMILASVTGEQ
jgi:hypothetical protein